MHATLITVALLAAADAAHAAPCVYNGNKVDYIDCIAAQSGDNEDDIAVIDAAVLDLDTRVAALETGAVSVAGMGLRTDRIGSNLAGLGSGAAYAIDLGDTFTLAPVTLPHGATVTDFSCTLKDEDATGYVQANLLRADMDSTSVFSFSTVGFVGTFPATNSVDYIRYATSTDPNTSVVDNARYTYYIRADLLDVTATFANVAVLGCSVEFTR